MRYLPSRSALYELAEKARLAPEIPKCLPTARWSPARLLEARAAAMPDQPALLFQDRRYTFRAVDEQANRWARWLERQGVAAGRSVALVFDNRPEMLFAQLGLSKLGAVAALINTNLKDTPLAHAITATSPVLVVVGQEHERAVADVHEAIGRVRVAAVSDGPASAALFPIIDAEVAACLGARPTGLPRPRAGDATSFIFTSGTTGLPKAARITNQRYVGASAMFGRVMHDLSPGDVLYVVLPLYHSNAQWMGWGSCLLTGATMALRRKFSASAFFDDVRRYRATHFLYIGEICRYLLHTAPRPDDKSHTLRIGVGNGLRADVWRAFQDRFGVARMREFYGATEGNALIMNVEGRPGMIGRLAPGHRVLACDPMTGDPLRTPDGLCRDVAAGETGLFVAWINPLTRFDGYLDEKATAKKVVKDVGRHGDAYFNSGDLLTVHDDGWVAFADRVGDTFRWKGENVSTTEVAEVLATTDGVLEANVYGVTVPNTEGRAGMASLRVDERFDLDGLARDVMSRLPAYQRPYFLRLSREMDVTGTFKHRKVDARDEGYDPARCGEPLYFLEEGKYVAIDAGFYARIATGKVTIR